LRVSAVRHRVRVREGREPGKEIWKGTTSGAIVKSIVLTAAIVVLATVACIAGEDHLPPFMLDQTRFSPQWPYIVGAPIASVSIAALIVLWIRRRSMLDLWLLVVMFLYLIEVRSATTRRRPASAAAGTPCGSSDSCRAASC
jgi:hypothetical protein